MTTERPLAGKTMAITRASHQARVLIEQLGALGATALLTPTIRIAPPDDFTPLDEALARLATYDWLLLTSVNGVDAFLSRLAAQRLDFGALTPLKIGVIGPATAKALADCSIHVDLVPDEYLAEGILATIGDVVGQRVLLPRAAQAREVLAETLRARGAVVDEIAAYQTLPGSGIAQLQTLLQGGALDAITFTSSSTVRFLFAGLGELGTDHEATLALLAQPTIACIGPITAATAREAGLQVAITAEEYTMNGLVAALIAHFSHTDD
jgi:uroporphyrinogen III methyltransferase/synthase